MNATIAITVTVFVSVALTVFLHNTIGQKYKHDELIRCGFGWLIVLGPVAVFCTFGVFDWFTWLAILLTAGADGAMLYLLITDERAAEMKMMRERVINDPQTISAVGELDSGGSVDTE